ncbi:MAG: hypothetical protein QXW70_02480 [Candidatus Anstonellales archaeon]
MNLRGITDKKFQILAFALLLLVGVLYSQAGTLAIRTGISQLCSFIKNLIPVISMLMLVGAGAVYAGGQLMGAETRARANVWATSMLTGALIGIVIVVVAPAILNTMYAGISGAC